MPPPRPFVNDALWQCLCPRFALQAARAAPIHAPPHASRRALRRYNTGAAFPASHVPSPASPPPPSFASLDPHSEGRPNRQSRDRPSLTLLSTPLLYDHLRSEGAKGNHFGVLDTCRVLIEQRGEARNAVMYAAILHSFVSCTNGTAGKVRAVLEEMGFWAEAGQRRVELDAHGCECVLEVLAVHPDYLLREEVLEYMRMRWFPLTDRGRSFVIAGLLRDRHFELALDMLEDMVRSATRIEGWLFDKAMWMLLEFDEVEEAFYVLSLKEARRRAKSQRSTATSIISEALWGALLDAAGRQQLAEHASKVWMAQVQPGHLKPATGTCLAVLALAAHHGLVPLATDVLRVLTERATPLTTHHYELLLATYLNANDLDSALSVLLIMAEASLKVDEGTCNPLFKYLCVEPDAGTEPSRPIHAFTLLRALEASGRTIPTAVVNACIQASISVSGLHDALEIYKELHTVARAGPNTQTFNILFRGCYLVERKELAMFLVNEMIQLGLKPDRITYDRLILVCLKVGDLEDALSYYEELVTQRVATGKKCNTPRRKTWELLISKCVDQGDGRAVALLAAYKKGVDEPRRDVERAVVGRFQTKAAAANQPGSEGTDMAPTPRVQ